MKLLFGPTSPYVRKVLVTAIETGIDGKIECLAANPYDEASNLRASNPLSKIPALITDAGDCLYDSPVICEFLDSLHDGEPVFPRDANRRFVALRQQALADGILDAALSWRYELQRNESLQSQDWIARQSRAIESALDALDREVVEWSDHVTIGKISVGCALGYLDFRFAEQSWRKGRVALEAWFDYFNKRDAMVRTQPAE